MKKGTNIDSSPFLLIELLAYAALSLSSIALQTTAIPHF